MVDNSKTDPTEHELESISKACNALWNLDENFCTPFDEYEIDLQGGKKVYQK